MVYALRVIYADVLFIINFCLDFLVLLSVGKILHFKLKLWKLIFSSVLGSLYAVAVVTLNLNGLFITLIHICMSMLMCYIAYNFTSALGYLKLVILFYMVSLLFGGGISALYNFASSIFLSFGQTRKGLSPLVFMAVTGIIFLFSMLGGKIFSKSASVSKIDAQVFFGDKSEKFSLLCDSGNLLRDPYSSLPVVIIKEKKLRRLLSKNDETINIFGLIDSENKDEIVRLKLRFIPISTPQGRSLIPGFRPDKLTVFHNNKKIDLDAVVAADNTDSDYGGTDGIIPSLLVDTI